MIKNIVELKKKPIRIKKAKRFRNTFKKQNIHYHLKIHMILKTRSKNNKKEKTSQFKVVSFDFNCIIIIKINFRLIFALNVYVIIVIVKVLQF